MKYRVFDVTILMIMLPLIIATMSAISCVFVFLEKRPFIFVQLRLGRERRSFYLIKVRTMRLGSGDIPSHLMSPSAITKLGARLRKFKLDEIPQLWNVIKGEMSLVGPRPCLPSQIELIEEREKRGVFDVRPGITGLAQINGIDMSTPQLLAETDAQMIATMNLKNYFKYILLTVLGRGFGDRVGLKK